ncbi:hypothetical protein SAMN05428939_8139 [Streptomyces sp. TLI_105]|nr:hypothetical protein SAMN05428939_8139 [Streptomyces sp. TLI_105]
MSSCLARLTAVLRHLWQCSNCGCWSESQNCPFC